MQEIGTKRTVVVELVGPAGAGKTSLAQALIQQDDSMRSGVCIQRYRHLPWLAKSTIGLLPRIVDHYRTHRVWLPLETKELVCLDALHSLLVREIADSKGMLILDQGPIYTLAFLRLRGHESIKNGCFSGWWQRSYRKWATMLDAIVWVDAPDSVLAHRIRTRVKPHEVKEDTDPAIQKFIYDFRGTYEEVIAALTAHNGPRLLKLDSERLTIPEMVNQVLALSSME